MVRKVWQPDSCWGQGVGSFFSSGTLVRNTRLLHVIAKLTIQLQLHDCVIGVGDGTHAVRSDQLTRQVST